MSTRHKTTAAYVPIDLLRKYDRPGPRYTSYPTAPEWVSTVGVDQYSEALRAASSRVEEPMAIYCHVPFCRRRCYYCGCNTCIVKDPSSADSYIDRLNEEIRNTAALLGSRNRVSQLHFGGGTPTYIGVEGLTKVLDNLEQFFEFGPDCERSIEIDPRVTTSGQLEFLAARGFNRVSLGVQDFESKVQVAIGRVQPLSTVENILSHCRRLNFTGINFDLIYGLPFQTVETFDRTLDQVIDLRPDRLAVYSFAYLPNIKSNQAMIDAEDLPDTEIKYRLFARAVKRLSGAGYRQIGMDHFALPDDELSLAQSDGRLHRNFMGYTVQSAPEMIGFGMSSIGYVNSSFFQNHSQLEAYKNAISGRGLAVYRGISLSDDDLIRQHVITSLMCNFHLDFEGLKRGFNVNYTEYFRSEHRQLTDFFEDGFIKESPRGLRITPLGRTFVRNIAMTFDAYLGHNNGKATFSKTI